MAARFQVREVVLLPSGAPGFDVYDAKTGRPEHITGKLACYSQVVATLRAEALNRGDVEMARLS
jgi:hypothetical protein